MYPLLTQMVLVLQHLPLMSVLQKFWICTRQFFPQLLSLSNQDNESGQTTLLIWRPHSPSRAICNSYWLKCYLCPRNYHQSYDLIHLWWPHVPHWRHTQRNSSGKILISLQTFIFRDFFINSTIRTFPYQHIPQNPCNHYCLRYRLSYPCNHYFLPRLPM